MGTRKSRGRSGGLAGALFTSVQRRVLGLLFGQPDRAFGSGELIRVAGSGTGAVHRQLQRLEAAGIITSQRIGNLKQYRVNMDSPIFSELHSLVLKTDGLVEPLRAALAPLARRIDVAFVFGSTAKGTEKAASDLDVFVVSDEIGYPELYEALMQVEEQLSRPVNPTVMKRAEWREKRAKRDSFARRVAEQPKLFVIGSENGLA